jgi:hypothetical protein
VIYFENEDIDSHFGEMPQFRLSPFLPFRQANELRKKEHSRAFIIREATKLASAYSNQNRGLEKWRVAVLYW